MHCPRHDLYDRKGFGVLLLYFCFWSSWHGTLTCGILFFCMQHVFPGTFCVFVFVGSYPSPQLAASVAAMSRLMVKPLSFLEKYKPMHPSCVFSHSSRNGGAVAVYPAEVGQRCKKKMETTNRRAAREAFREKNPLFRVGHTHGNTAVLKVFTCTCEHYSIISNNSTALREKLALFGLLAVRLRCMHLFCCFCKVS